MLTKAIRLALAALALLAALAAPFATPAVHAECSTASGPVCSG